MTHTVWAAAAGVAVPCTSVHCNYGGACLNCGWEPEVPVEVPVPHCLVCGEDTTHNRKSSMFNYVHRWGPMNHAFKSSEPEVNT